MAGITAYVRCLDRQTRLGGGYNSFEETPYLQLDVFAPETRAPRLSQGHIKARPSPPFTNRHSTRTALRIRPTTRTALYSRHTQGHTHASGTSTDTKPPPPTTRQDSAMPHRKHAPVVKPLLLAGGPSARLGFPKHLLRMPDGRPLYQHQLDRLHRACPGADALYVSLGRSSVLDGFLRDVARPLLPRRRGSAAASTPGPIAVVYDREERDALGGPVAGLLAAHDADPDAAWLVLACHYPLLTGDVLARVRDLHEGALTCVRGPDGEPEPLIGLWSPEALRELAARVRGGKADGVDEALGSFVAECGSLVVDPPEPRTRVMMRVETESDWNQVYRLASEAAAVGKKDRVTKGSSIQTTRSVAA
ncbi:hypothetical protein RB601_002753 [Gaeumannomyces tritici]